MIRFVSLVALGATLLAGPASAVVYCKSVGVPKGCVARPTAAAAAVATPGVGAPGVGVGAITTSALAGDVTDAARDAATFP